MTVILGVLPWTLVFLTQHPSLCKKVIPQGANRKHSAVDRECQKGRVEQTVYCVEKKNETTEAEGEQCCSPPSASGVVLLYVLYNKVSEEIVHCLFICYIILLCFHFSMQ